jgi:hypothetical protein
MGGNRRLSLRSDTECAVGSLRIQDAEARESSLPSAPIELRVSSSVLDQQRGLRLANACGNGAKSAGPGGVDSVACHIALARSAPCRAHVPDEPATAQNPMPCRRSDVGADEPRKPHREFDP